MQLIDGQPVFAATDLVGFLACQHRFELERAALAGLVKRPIRNDPAVELIAKRGLEHEARYLADLQASGRSVAKIDKDGSASDAGSELRAAAVQTMEAMRAGLEVVYQATFFDGRWRGHADFLLRVERPSNLGPWSYEVADTKLARHVKGSAILQVCSYVEQLTAAQGRQPEKLHIVLGGSAHQTASFRVADYMAYYRRVKADFEADFGGGSPQFPPVATYPEPVEHCEVCRWAVDCRARRLADDDLSLVAGIAARQRRGLKAMGVATRRGLAALALPLPAQVTWSGPDALRQVREQARLQVASDGGTIQWELLPLPRDDAGSPVPDRGLLILPQPSEHDLFFDIEGDPFALDDGVEYLFGVLEPCLSDPERLDQPRFHELWSREADGSVTRAGEKHAFEALVDLLINRLDVDPAMHVYHYAAYERSALARLAQRHATREDEVDRLLRGGVLVDLYRVVRQGLRAGVESYSIKKLEPLYGLKREAELRSAGNSIVAFEAWLEGGATEDGQVGEVILREIAGYNRDDVLSNWRLREWLETCRARLAAEIEEALPRPGVKDDAIQAKPLSERAARVAALADRLTAGVPGNAADRTGEEQATWLLAQLLSWHRREDKAGWWRFFEQCAMTSQDLIAEREPLGGLELDEDLGVAGRGGRMQRFRFPPQDHACRVGRSVTDPATGKETGTVTQIDEASGAITLHRTRGQVERGVPRGLIPWERVRTDNLEEGLISVGEWVAEHGISEEGPFRAARDLLLGLPPRARGSAKRPDVGPGFGRGAGPDGRRNTAPLRRPDETSLAAACRLGLALEQSTLPIQGPPGSGKTYTGARMVLDLVKAGRTVGIAANSHKVIGNMLDAIHEAAVEAGVPIRIGQKPGKDEPPTCRAAVEYPDEGAIAGALAGGEVDVVGGTAWLWAHPGMTEAIDVLFVDEAGQMALANVIAASRAAGSLVLIGDPQQLDQPLQGSHPPGAERSALGHLLGERATIPEDRGLFLDRTWRLHPDLCAYTSEVFYDGELLPEPVTARQDLVGPAPTTGTGLRWLPVRHEGNNVDSPEEAAVIKRMLDAVVAVGASWVDGKGEEHDIRLADVVIVAPYNAHVERITRALPEGARVGTVDKFQGQEAAISIYALGTSSPELAPRGMEFLYSLNRLNVATSRARCLALVVGSPALLRVQCHTPHQMRLANALARLVEVSRAAVGG